MDEREPKTDGWLDSIRSSGDSLLGLAQSRLELFAVELQEEKLRALTTLMWLVVAVTFVVTGLLVGLGALALYLWSLAGYLGLVGLSLLTLATGAGIVWRIHHRIQNGPAPFAETIGEFRKDRECLRKDH